MAELTLSARAARRLAVHAQGLGAERLPPDPRGIVGTVEGLRWLQLDPTSAVARTQHLVLWSRLGAYDRTMLDRLIYRDRRLLEWRAFIYPMRDLPFYRLAMRELMRRPGPWAERATWMRANGGLRREVLGRLRREGPLATSAFEGRAALGWQGTGWTNEPNPSQMLACLSAEGRVMVAGRQGQERLWDLAERCVPKGALETTAGATELIRDATVLAARSLGIARAKHVAEIIPWSLRPQVKAELSALERAGILQTVGVDGTAGRWLVHRSDAARAERLEASDRTTLLSPFDNLIRERPRTKTLFGMRYRLEIYVPKTKREYGFFVMPILRGEELIGRVDPTHDRALGVLRINALHLQPGTRRDRATGRAIAGALQDLAAFLGARDVVFARAPRVPGLG